MKIEVIKTKEYKEIIDVEFPYYYENNYSDHSDCTYYKKIMQDYYIEIIERRSYQTGFITYEISKEWNYLNYSYYDAECKSTKANFDAVKERAIKFLQDIE